MRRHIPTHDTGRVVLHLSLDPTASTSVQHYLEAHAECYAAVDISVHTVGFGEPEQRGQLTEALSSKTTSVVVPIQDPVDSLWSGWQRTLAEGAVTNWPTFVAADMQRHRLSEAITHWSPIASSRTIDVVAATSGSSVSLLRIFLRAAGLDPCNCGSRDEHLDAAGRERHSDLEYLFYPLLTRWVLHWLDVSRRESGVVEDTSVQRVLRAIYATRPCFEIAAAHEDAFAVDRLGLYDSSSVDAVRAYAARWADDLHRLLSGAHGPLSPTTVNTLIEQQDHCRRTLGQFAPNADPLPTFPALDHAERLPLTSGLIGLARTIARSILLVNEQDRR